MSAEDVHAQLQAAQKEIAELNQKLEEARQFIQANQSQQNYLDSGLISSESVIKNPAVMFEILVENSPDTVMIINQDGKILFCNHSLEENKVEDILGQFACDYFPEPTQVRFRRALTNVIEKGEHDIFEHQLSQGNWWLTRVIPVEKSEAREGSTAAAILVSTDITDHKRSELERRQFREKMQQTQKLESLGVLAGGIAHDFNNLLVGVLGHAELALDALPSTDPARIEIDQIQAASMRAADLCKQLLAYSGKGRFVVKSIDLGELVEDMVHLLEVSVSKKVVLTCHFEENLPPVEVDINQLRQVVMNLVTNASEAIGDRSGVIAVRTGMMEASHEYLSEIYLDDNLPEGFYVFLEVSDTGCGMDTETQSKIFDPFFTTKFTGRGLGLAAVLGIMRGHKGVFKVYSEIEKGTTVKILLPFSSNPAEILDSPKNETRGHWQGKGTILVVDDEETVRSVFKHHLSYHGFHVFTANDGREALEIFKENQDLIDVIILDLTMPHMGGEDAFRQLRMIDPDVKVLLTSGYNEQEITGRFSGKGLAGFVQKPYKKADLMDLLREVLGLE